jgi:hypothetical protein
VIMAIFDTPVAGVTLGCELSHRTIETSVLDNNIHRGTFHLSSMSRSFVYVIGHLVAIRVTVVRLVTGRIGC